MFFVFFKQKTAYEMRISDWSSDVCSSDLKRQVRALGGQRLAGCHQRHRMCHAPDEAAGRLGQGHQQPRPQGKRRSSAQGSEGRPLMGTSTAYGGPGGGTTLVPSWLGDAGGGDAPAAPTGDRKGVA